MSLSILANAKFGWIFIWTEIILIYLAFLWFHRIVAKQQKAK
jgi:hypothetical protein